MLTRSRTAHITAEQGIFGDEDAAALRAEVAELREVVAQIGAQVQSQFTTIAAHAEIARQQAEHTRDEARADLDRTRGVLIDLIERVRSEIGGASPGTLPGATPSEGAAGGQERIEAIERRLEEVVQAVTTCFDRQRELADTMAALVDMIFADRGDEPVGAMAWS